MSTGKRSFSTQRGIGFIALVFLALVVLPALKRHQHAYLTSKDASSSPPITHLPLDYKLRVFRDSSKKQLKRNSRAPLKDLLAGEKSLALVNFWATWCPPCLEEIPSLEQLNRQFNHNLELGKPAIAKLITVSVDDRMEDIVHLENTLDFKPTFSVFHDPEGELARTLGTTKFPETFLINSDGEILYKWLGPQDWLSLDVLHQIEIHSK